MLFEGEAKKKISNLILVQIFPGFPRIRTEYGEIRSISPYSVRMRENAGKMRTRITANTDSFYAVDAPNAPIFKY